MNANLLNNILDFEALKISKVYIPDDDIEEALEFLNSSPRFILGDDLLKQFDRGDGGFNIKLHTGVFIDKNSERYIDTALYIYHINPYGIVRDRNCFGIIRIVGFERINGVFVPSKL